MRSRHIAYALTTVLVVLAFVGSGVGNLFRLDPIAHDMIRLGYPTYFMTVLGTWKLAGALVVALPGLPRAKEWAYAGMIFDLTGAAASRAATGDAAITIVPPLMIALVVFASWSLRPERRRLVSLSAST